ncbi:hypothetical protein DRE_03164 [Drechslerella stenobrocha 248]|uniref:Large ribosomal subunit protein bL28m n=1 Tax=Drechslerella stenobrocha 248 TaxID=1043628 RepID=W7HVK5_9PEZI|nr:hypothetical protein DRE_03164 [Drechslerella stenobrocha 248]
MPPRILRPLLRPIPSLATKPTPSSCIHIFPAARPFSTTRTTALGSKSAKHKLTKLLSKAPPYPYPIRETFKQSWFGLYAGKHVQFGNNIPNKKYIITRRRWMPNIKHKKLWSFGLGEWVRCKLATNVLRTIDKVGGLDNYLLSEKPARLKELGPWGWELRYRLQCSKSVQRRYQQDRLAMGLLSKEQLIAQNERMGISKGVHEVESTHRKAPRNAKTRLLGFGERWEKSAKVKKVLIGEPWRSRLYVKRMTTKEWEMKLEAEGKRLARAEAVMARQKAENRRLRELRKEEERQKEAMELERLTKQAAAREARQKGVDLTDNDPSQGQINTDELRS